MVCWMKIHIEHLQPNWETLLHWVHLFPEYDYLSFVGSLVFRLVRLSRDMCLAVLICWWQGIRPKFHLVCLDPLLSLCWCSWRWSSSVPFVLDHHYSWTCLDLSSPHLWREIRWIRLHRMQTWIWSVHSSWDSLWWSWWPCQLGRWKMTNHSGWMLVWILWRKWRDWMLPLTIPEELNSLDRVFVSTSVHQVYWESKPCLPVSNF